MAKELSTTTSNEIAEAIYHLDTNEHRLIYLAIANAREKQIGICSDTLLEITAVEYAEQFHVTDSAAYQALQKISLSLFNSYLKYTKIDPTDGKKIEFRLRWVDKIGYKKSAGSIFLRFSQDIVPHITRLQSNFTDVKVDEMSRLKSSYAIRVFQLLMQWKSVGHTPMYDIAKFRDMLGIESDKYNTASNFKKNVIDVIVEQINSLTDYEIYNPIPLKDRRDKEKDYFHVQNKRGRKITGYQFYFRKKKVIEGKCKDISQKRDPNIPDLSPGLTDNEQAVAKATADKHIKNNGITDPLHKINIHAKAQKERWGLGEHDKETDDYNLQNQQVTQQIEADKAKEQVEKEAMALQKQSNEQFISHFENLSNDEQERILNNVEASVSNIPVLGDIFRKNRQAGTAHKDISFRSQFKNAMS